MDILVDFKNYDREETIFKRTASRAIISDGKKYLLITSKYGDYKFPGGGQDKGENLVDTLIREIQEALAVHSMKRNLAETGKIKDYSFAYRTFFEELGIAPDEEKIRYYILFDELF